MTVSSGALTPTFHAPWRHMYWPEKMLTREGVHTGFVQ